MLTNTEIESLAAKMKIPLGHVGFKDELSAKNLKSNKYYIINLEDSQCPESKEMNQGSHWTGFEVRESHNGRKEAIYFDSYGFGPPEYIKKIVKQKYGIPMYYPKKDIQSLVNNACGYFQLAFAHLLHDRRMANGTLKEISDLFQDMFLDLNKDHDFKRNEWVLAHFFQSTDPKVRKAVPLPEVISTEK